MNNHNDAVLLDNIRRILDEKGIKHCKVAAACGMTNAEFSRMLSGNRVFRTCYVPPIASVLGCSYNDLFAEKQSA